jgi:GxxExxY protein
LNHQGTKNTKQHKDMFMRLSEQEERVAKQIVDIAYCVHKSLGPGLLESVHEKCFCYELIKRGINFTKQKPVPVIYDDLVIDDGLRLDILVEGIVVVELKAFDTYHPIWEAQHLSYLRLSRNRLGFLINFHVPLIKDGIKRFIL